MTRIPIIKSLFLACLCVTIADGLSQAQAPPGRMGDSGTIGAQLNRGLSSHVRIRLVANGWQRVFADDPKVVGDSLVATIRGSTWAFALTDIDTVWVRKGKATGLVAAITGVPFAIGGALLGMALACGDEPSPCPNNDGKKANGALVGATFFGTPAALAGALIGSMITRWNRIYVRTPSSTR